MSSSKTQIVVVEDNEDFRDILCTYLTTFKDIEVAGVASNGFEALDLIANKQPDVVIMDIVMQHLDGISVLERMADIDMDKRPQIIMLSALGQPKVVKKALSLGAEFFMVKPFDMNALVEKIRQLA